MGTISIVSYHSITSESIPVFDTLPIPQAIYMFRSTEPCNELADLVNVLTRSLYFPRYPVKTLIFTCSLVYIPLFAGLAGYPANSFQPTKTFVPNS